MPDKLFNSFNLDNKISDESKYQTNRTINKL